MIALFAYRLAYDGRSFHGFQRQPDVPTVEGALMKVLTDLGVVEAAETPPGYAAGGRTDAGVSATGQTVAFEAPDWLDPSVLSRALPDEVHVWSRAEAPPTFHATHDAVYRRYTYHLWAADLDEASVRRAIGTLSGYHDFHNLTPEETSTRRVVHLSVERDDRWLVISAIAPGFAHHLLRRIVAAVGAVGGGEAPLRRIGRLLSAEKIPGHLNVGPAAPEPLVLRRVHYDSIDFETDPEADEAMRAWLDEIVTAASTRARQFGDVRDQHRSSMSG